MKCSKCDKNDVHYVYRTPEEWWILKCLTCDNIEEYVSDEKMEQLTSGYKPFTLVKYKN